MQQRNPQLPVEVHRPASSTPRPFLVSSPLHFSYTLTSSAQNPRTMNVFAGVRLGLYCWCFFSFLVTWVRRRLALAPSSRSSFLQPRACERSFSHETNALSESILW